MKQPQLLTSTPTLHALVVPQLPEKTRRLVDAACAAYGGAGRMSLGDWRAVEEELKRKLEYEHQKHQRLAKSLHRLPKRRPRLSTVNL